MATNPGDPIPTPVDDPVPTPTDPTVPTPTDPPMPGEPPARPTQPEPDIR